MRPGIRLAVAAFCLTLTGSMGCQTIYGLLNALQKSTGGDDQQAAGDPNYSDILAAADRKAKERDPNAVIFQVTGDNVGVLKGTGAQTMTYTFLACNPARGVPMWRIVYDRLEDKWQLEELSTPILGVAFVDLTTIEMTEEEARAFLAANDFANDFTSWGLAQVLYPAATHPVFSFIYSNQVIVIDPIAGAITYEAVNPGGSGGTNPAGGEVLGTTGEDSVSLQMIHAATEEIQQTVRSAFVFWAGGREGSGGELNQPGDTNHWDFYAAANLDSEPRIWTMAYDGTWQITETNIPPLGVELIDITCVTMDVVEAWDLAVNAGYFPPFGWWVVFKPLHPDAHNPVYVFSTPYAYVLVDTVTGEVTEERTARNPLGDCLYGCRESYLECVDYCRFQEPGVGDCYDECADSRDRCDRACYEDND